eukprot:341135-Prymnesium_polylepis.1
MCAVRRSKKSLPAPKSFDPPWKPSSHCAGEGPFQHADDRRAATAGGQHHLAQSVLELSTRRRAVGLEGRQDPRALLGATGPPLHVKRARRLRRLRCRAVARLERLDQPHVARGVARPRAAEVDGVCDRGSRCQDGRRPRCQRL